MTWRSSLPLGLLTACVMALPSLGQTAGAQTDVPVRMRIELLSIRNRSASPIPVQIRLEYNRPQILQGDLELSLYDSLAVLSPEDLRATVRIEDIVLSGADQTFHALFPPVQTGLMQNLAVMAWFRTADGRIPLSLSRKEINPPLPHDLLMISPRERGTLMCSCSGLTSLQKSAPGQKFLNRALSLENYNPLAEPDRKGAEGGAAEGERESAYSSGGAPGEHIQYFPVTVSPHDLPEDPLSFCAFDVLLLADQALEKLSREQLQAILTWVRAGGSLCILPDGRMKLHHLEFLRTVFETEADVSVRFSLDDDGRLLSGASGVTVIHRFVGLGRASLLPAADDLSVALNKSDVARLVAFLWKVRTDVPVWRGEPWRIPGIQDRFRESGISERRASDDADAVTRDGSDLSANTYLGGGSGGRSAVPPESPRADQQLAPLATSLLPAARDALMPDDVRMVPVWVIGLILAAYVATIGPVDYFVLGMLRMRKATWILFPVVTAFFTLQTVWIAHIYMSSTDTGGTLDIVDVIDDGQPVRRTRVELRFYGAAATHRSEHHRQLVVSLSPELSADISSAIVPGFTSDQAVVPESLQPLSYSGRFPQSYSVTQTVPQWSPRMTRVMEFNPADVRIPGIDWTDSSLITSSTGRRRLGENLEDLFREPGEQCFAVILHRDQQLPVLRSGAFVWVPQTAGEVNGMPLLPILAEATGQTRTGVFRIVSQLSPQGSAAMEDLHLLDDTSKAQWVLLIVVRQRNNYRVFRKLYHVEERSGISQD